MYNQDSNKILKKNINKPTLLIIVGVVFVVAVLGLILGTFLDWKISSWLAGDCSKTQSSFGWYFSPFAGIFATIAFAFALSVVLTGCWIQTKWSYKIKIPMAIIVLISGFFILLWQTYDGLIQQIWEGFHIPVSEKLTTANSGFNGIIILLSAIAALVLLGLFMSLNLTIWLNYQKGWFKWGVWAFFSMILSCLVIFIMKANIHRERYFQIIGVGSDPAIQFKNWYSLLWNMNTSADGSYSTAKMTSFPSGHTTWAMAVLTLIPMTTMIHQNKRILKLVLSIIPVVFLFVLMFSRIQAGCHYLSDVSMAVIVNGLCFAGTFGVFYLINNDFKELILGKSLATLPQ